MMKIQENVLRFKQIKKEYIENLIINFMFGITFFIINLVILSSLRSSNKIFINIVYVSLFFVVVVIYVLIKDFIKMKKAKQYIDNLEEYNKNLIEVHDSMRSFKHDFNNIMQAMNGYIMLKDMKSLEEYFHKLLKECQYVKNVDCLNSGMVNSPAIYSILINKYKIAEKNDIKMNIDILIDFDNINDKVYDISRMLGILLDNAIEATNDCDEKIINIQFLYDPINKKSMIIIENTYKDIGIDVETIFQKNFTTKKGNSGLGLWEIRKILSKNANLDLYTTKNNNMFKQQLEIYA